jgi:dihydrofolate reductase
MPWHIPEDFKFFKQTTMGHAMIMGRKTYESIGRPLPGRLTIVVTRGAFDPGHPDVVVVKTIEAALAHAASVASQWGDEVFIAGGGEIYRQTLARADRIYLTEVEQAVDGDTTYPAIDAAAYVADDLGHFETPVPYDRRVLNRRS